MTPEALRWAQQWAPRFPVSVLDVGGRDINGTARPAFDAKSYTSIDLHPGPGVDIVGDFTEYAGEVVDVVVCMEVAEHTEKWPLIVANAANHLDDGGLFIFTAAGPGWPPHSASDGGPLQEGEWYQNIEPVELRIELSRHFASYEVDLLDTSIRAVAWR